MTEQEEALGIDIYEHYMVVRRLIAALDHPATRTKLLRQSRTVANDARRLITALDQEQSRPRLVERLSGEARA